MERFWRTSVFFGGFVFLVAMSIFVSLLSWEKSHPYRPVQERTLPISAEGRVFAKPDVGQVTFTVLSEGRDPKMVEDENAKKINAVINFVKSEGVKDDDIKTSQFSLQPKYYYPYEYPRIPCPELGIPEKPMPCPPPGPVVIGYTLSQSITVKIRNFENAGKILAGAIERGANQVGSFMFAVEDMDVYKKEARELAFRKAKAQAEELAALGGFKIKAVLSINEGYTYAPQIMLEGRATAGAMPEKATTPPKIESGSQEVVVTLNVVFKIE